LRCKRHPLLLLLLLLLPMLLLLSCCYHCDHYCSVPTRVWVLHSRLENRKVSGQAANMPRLDTNCQQAICDRHNVPTCWAGRGWMLLLQMPT
jgi:hypothetical protein